jgi:hypothetical protein
MKLLFKLHHLPQVRTLLLPLLQLNQPKVLLVTQLQKPKKNYHQKQLLKFRKVPIFQLNQHQLKHQLVLKLHQLPLLNLLLLLNPLQRQSQHLHLHLNQLNQPQVKLLQVKNQQHQLLLKRNQSELLL